MTALANLCAFYQGFPACATTAQYCIL